MMKRIKLNTSLSVFTNCAGVGRKNKRFFNVMTRATEKLEKRDRQLYLCLYRNFRHDNAW